VIAPIFSHVTPKSERHRPTVECTAAEDKCRQEFKAETDTHLLLKRYGAGVPLRQVAYGEAYTDVDRLTALAHVSRLQEAFTALPDHIRSKFGSWESVFAAIQSGELSSLEAPSEPVKEG